MTLTDAIAPTPERLAKIDKDRLEKPEISPHVKRVAYRSRSPFEVLHADGRISDGCKLAADKLTKHYLGSLGVDVRSGDGTYDECLEDPRTYHSQMVAQMRDVVGHAAQWNALLALVDETMTLDEIGRHWMGCRTPVQGRIAGLALIRLGLERIEAHYGLSSNFHPPDRSRQ
jgi:hypothetical protein